MADKEIHLDKISKGDITLQKKINDANKYFNKIDRNQFEDFRKHRNSLNHIPPE
ncbi:MAG: hypothetical protein RLZZ306_1796 [Bacteroidota bacterium]|jgi:hypothetical protein